MRPRDAPGAQAGRPRTCRGLRGRDRKPEEPPGAFPQAARPGRRARHRPPAERSGARGRRERCGRRAGPELRARDGLMHTPPHLPARRRVWILQVLLVILLAGHGLILYYVSSHVMLSAVVLSGAIILLAIKHAGLLGPVYGF